MVAVEKCFLCERESTSVAGLEIPVLLQIRHPEVKETFKLIFTLPSCHIMLRHKFLGVFTWITLYINYKIIIIKNM